LRKMLVNEAEKDAWVIGDSWRGIMQITEIRNYLHPMLTYKLLCENTNHSFNISKSHSWEKITSNGIDFGKKLQKAFQQLENLNDSLKDVFTIFNFDSIEDDLSLFKVADSVLNRHSFSRDLYDDPSSLIGTVTKYLEDLLEAFISREGAYGGESSSPRSITTLLPRLLDKTSGTICDHASGLNGFLIEANKYARLNKGEVELYGQEINPQTRALGIMNLIIHEMYPEVADVKLGNTITNPQLKDDDGQLMKFDGILSSPPFALSNWGYEEAEKDVYGRFRYGLPSRSYGDMAFVLHSISTLKEDGKAVIVVPNGVLFRGASEGKIRASLIQENLIEAVIGLPANLFIGTGIPVAVLVINKNKLNAMKDRILFINAEDSYGKAMRNQNVMRESDIIDIVDAYQNYKQIEGYSRIVPINEIADNDWNLNPMRYLERAEVSSKIGNANINRKKYEQSELPKVLLGEIADVERGINPSKEESEESEATHYLVNLVNVQNDRIIAEGLKGITLSPRRARDYELEAGDILLSSRGTMPKMTVVTPEDIQEKPLVFSQNFLRIRASDRTKFEPHFIKAFLESPIGQYYLQAYQRGTTVTVLSHKDVASIKLPKLTVDQQREVAQMLLQADELYQKAMEEAKTKHEQSYSDSYHLMGISDTYSKVD